MKVGIITFHFASNQGAALQCYALQKCLESLGHEASVIDYRPRYHTVMHAAWKDPFAYTYLFWKRFKMRSLPIRIYLTARSFVRCMYLNIMGIDRKTHAAFSAFVEKNLHLTKKYTTLKQLQNDPPVMQAYISGSDQLWNPEILDQSLDRAYFLDFGNEDVLRITYAVSIGQKQDNTVLLQIKGLCSRLNAISLREYSETAIKAIDRDVHICLDPTLLLDAQDYQDVEGEDTEGEPYIFVYGFETNDNMKQGVELARKKYNCRVLNGSPKWVKLDGDIADIADIEGYGPERFLSLIKNAKCIITNSFHGTTFSVIYKKDFITVPHSTRGKRMTELLNKLGITNRLLGSENFSFEGKINYSEVYEKLNALRRYSKEYLIAAIRGRSGEMIPHHPNEEQYLDARKNGYEKLRAYYGYYCDNEQLKQSASGGVATALSEIIISENGVVVGVAYSDDFKSAEFRCVESMEGLEKLKGSKYIPPKTNIGGKLVYDIVEEKLVQGRKVLFIGSGCHVGALLKRLEMHNTDTTNLYTVDLICHGPTFQFVQEEFIKNLELKYGAQVTDFSVRYKKHGWVPPYVKAVFANGKQYSKPLYETDLGYAFRIYVRESCYNCKYKGERHVADITIGDFWGLRPGMKEYNRNGVSVMLSRSEKGNFLINSIDQKRFFVGNTSADIVIDKNRMFEISLKKPIYVSTFENDIKEKGLHYAVMHSQGYKSYVKRAIKNRVLKIAGFR